MHGAVLVAWSGLSEGSMAAFVAVGMALFVRSTGVMNLAQGEYFVVAALLASSLVHGGVPLGVVVLFCGGLGAVGCAAQEMAIMRPTSNATPSVRLLITVALATMVEGIEYLVWGPNSHGAPTMLAGRIIGPGGVIFSAQSLLVVGAALVLAVGSYLVFERGRTGEALAALAEDPVGAQLIGVRTPRLRSWTAIAAGLVAGLGGALAVPLYAQNFASGLPLALDGFIAVAIGRGRVVGSAAAGLALGVVSAGVTRYISALYVDAVTFGILAAVVLLSPGLVSGETAS